MNLLNILKNISVFNNLTTKDLDKIIPLLTPIKYPENTPVIKEGEQGFSMFILIKGSVKVTKSSKINEEVLISYLYPGSYFGELSLIDNVPRSANVITIEETQMLQLSKSDFDNLLDSDKSIAVCFYKNTLKETFHRFRNILSNFTFSQHILKEKSETLEEINKDLNLAKQVQDFFISSELQKENNKFSSTIKSSFLYNPCSEVGGDFLNLVAIDDDNLGIIIADVVGHGITAAMATGILKSAFTFYVDQFGKQPEVLMEKLNDHYFKVMSKLYATCYYSAINIKDMTISVSKAGHHHPLFWKHSIQDFVEVQCVGMGLGFMETAKYSTETHKIEKGDKLLFYTDGIVEERDALDEMYSDTRLQQKFKEFILSKSENILNDISEDLKTFSGKEKYDDDITILLIEI